jgi:hypothetical protein
MMVKCKNYSRKRNSKNGKIMKKQFHLPIRENSLISKFVEKFKEKGYSKLCGDNILL